MPCSISSATSAALLPNERRRIRQERSKPLLEELESWLREQRDRLSRGAYLRVSRGETSAAVLDCKNYGIATVV